MRIGKLEIYSIVLTLLVSVALILFTAPFEVLASCVPLLLLSAFGLCAASLFLRCLVWVLLTAAALPDFSRAKAGPEIKAGPGTEQYVRPDSALRNPVFRGGLFAVSVISLVGMITPMRLGLDVLRSVYGKSRLGIPFENTAAASILTRELKVHVSLFLAFGLMLGAATQHANFTEAAAWSVVSLLLVLVGFIALRTNPAGNLARRLHAGNFTDAVKSLHRQAGPARKVIVYLLYLAAFIAEWLSLHLCFLAIHLQVDILNSFAIYLLLYFLSTAPLLPQGTGAVETGALILLRIMHVPSAQAGALVVLWDAVRILTPPVLAALFSVGLAFSSERPRA